MPWFSLGEGEAHATVTSLRQTQKFLSGPCLWGRLTLPLGQIVSPGLVTWLSIVNIIWGL